MKKIIVRIIGNGYDINGNYTHRVYAYQERDWGEPTVYSHLSREEMKSRVRGRINKDNSITTQADKKEIIEGFADVDAGFIFE